MSNNYTLPIEVKKLVFEASPQSLSHILNDVFFEMHRDTNIKEIVAVKAVIESRDDSQYCSSAVDVCDVALVECGSFHTD